MIVAARSAGIASSPASSRRGDPRRDPHRPSRTASGRCSSRARTRCTRCPTAPRMREALAALDCVVVIDVALTETARCARLRAARGLAVREVGGRVLHARVPGERIPAPRRRSSSRCRARCPRPRSTRGWRERSAPTATTTSPGCTRPPRDGPAGVRRCVPDGDGRAAAPRAARADRPLRDARPDVGRGPRRSSRGVGSRADVLPVPCRVGAARRVRRRRRALRRDDRQPFRRRVHRSTTTRRPGSASTRPTARSAS